MLGPYSCVCLICLWWMSGADVGGAVFNSRVRKWFWGFRLMVFSPNQLCPLALCIYSVKQIHAKILLHLEYVVF